MYLRHSTPLSRHVIFFSFVPRHICRRARKPFDVCRLAKPSYFINCGRIGVHEFAYRLACQACYPQASTQTGFRSLCNEH